MTSHRLWQILHARVKEWRPDSGIRETRQFQRQAQEQMLLLLSRAHLVQTDRLSHLIRFWLLDVSPQMSSYSANGEPLPGPCSRVIRGIPESLHPWQMVALDRLRFTGVDGVTAEIRCKPDDTSSWWLTLTWQAPALIG